MKITKFDYSRILISSIVLLCTTIFISGISYDVNYAEAELPTSPCSYLDAGKEGTRYVKISYDEITKKDFCQNTWDYFHDITESDCNAGKYVNYCRVPQVCQFEAGRVETDPDCKPKLKPTPLSETSAPTTPTPTPAPALAPKEQPPSSDPYGPIFWIIFGVIAIMIILMINHTRKTKRNRPVQNRTKKRQATRQDRPKERREAVERVRVQVYRRDGFKCQCTGCSKCQSEFWSNICGRGKPGLNIHHIKPYSKGGTDDMDNLQTLCEECNKEQGNKYEGSGRSYHE